jgi:hypothetical protein
MSDETRTDDKARPIGFSGYQRHVEIIRAIRVEREKRDQRLPKTSEVVQDAIEELGLRELGAVRFGQVMAKAS